MNAQTPKPTNLSLDRELLAEARALDMNPSRAAEAGLQAAVKERQLKAITHGATRTAFF